jgi:hypothetical protein
MAIINLHAIQIREMVTGNGNQFKMSATVVWWLYKTSCWETGSDNQNLVQDRSA